MKGGSEGPTIGSRLAHYQITALLGRGGMGEVYRASDTKLGREVAIKVLPAEMASDPRRIERFRREARALAALDHPNIVTIHSVEEVGGVHFLTMALVVGRTLDQLVPAGGLSLSELLDLAIPLTEALAAAHAKGITHRDLKPTNVMVTEGGEVKVLDFGVAKLTGGLGPDDPAQLSTELLTSQGQLVGTPSYMSPEQVRGETVDERSDLFSLGVMLFELATGERPFRGATFGEVVSSLLRDRPAELSDKRPEMATDLGSIVGRCLEKEPRRRYRSADDLRRELEGLRRGAGRDRPAAAGHSPRAVRHAIAVLPLTDFSGDPGQEFFADGMTEALITDLAKIRSLKVISRASVMRFKGSTESLPEIGRRLGVDTIVAGSVVRGENRVRINAQLIDAVRDEHLWAESYQRELRSILDLQGEVARAVAHQIKVQLTPDEAQELQRRRPVDPKAYEEYLRGRFHWNKRTRGDFAKGLQHFRRAIEHDPAYALAHVGLADTYALQERYGIAPAREVMPRAKAAALRALDLDPHLAEAHAALGLILSYYDWDWAAAEETLRTAITLNPDYAVAHHWYGWLLAHMGRHEQALAEIRTAQDLDPLSLIINTNVATIIYFTRDYERAAHGLRRTLDLSPDFPPAHQWLARTYEQQGRLGDAIDSFQRALDLLDEDPESIAGLAHARALAGDTDRARAALAELEGLGERRFVSPYWTALVQAGMGEIRQALGDLESAYEMRFDWMMSLKVEPSWDPLRDQPGFQEIYRRMGFPE